MSKVTPTKAEHIYDSYWECNNFRIIECRSCGFKHLDPVPDEETLRSFYRDKYFRDVKPFPYENVTADFIVQRERIALTHPLHQEIYSMVNKYKKTSLKGMLDIGCGNNLLSKYFQSQGWDVNIIEPSEDAGNYLKKFGLTVFNKPVEEIDNLGIKGISFINMDYVLEHLQNPVKILLKLNKLLEWGGVIRINVPNDFSEGQLAYQEYYKEQPNWVCLPDHINYFTFDSLSNLLKRAGFREVYRTTNFPLEFLLMAGINYYANEEEKEKVGPFVVSFERSLKGTNRSELLKQLYDHFAQLGFGRSVIMYAIKE